MTEASTSTTSIFPPWDIPQWHAVDDRVRGGSSVSHLDSIVIPLNDAGKRKGVAARFWGTLGESTHHEQL